MCWATLIRNQHGNLPILPQGRLQGVGDIQWVGIVEVGNKVLQASAFGFKGWNELVGFGLGLERVRVCWD